MKKKVNLLINNFFEKEFLDSRGTRRAHQFFSDIIAMSVYPGLIINPEYEEGLNRFFKSGNDQYDSFRDALKECFRISAEMRLEIYSDDYSGICLEINFYSRNRGKKLFYLKTVFDPIIGKCNYYRYFRYSS